MEGGLGRQVIFQFYRSFSVQREEKKRKWKGKEKKRKGIKKGEKRKGRKRKIYFDLTYYHNFKDDEAEAIQT